MRWGAVVVGIGWVALGACTLFTPFDTDLTSGDPIVIEAGVDAPDAGSVTDGGRAAPDGSLPDGSADGGATGCTKNGDLVRPIRVFDATPVSVGAGTQVCNIEAVLVEDGVVAGLDRGNGNYETIDGQGIVSCIGVEMAANVVIDRVLVRAKAVQAACGGMCIAPNCDTGHSFPIYVGTTATDLVMAENGNEASTTLQTIDVAAPSTIDARFIVVCRSTWGLDRDDIAIDSIAAICR